jgi:hypothetical protein
MITTVREGNRLQPRKAHADCSSQGCLRAFVNERMKVAIQSVCGGREFTHTLYNCVWRSGYTETISRQDYFLLGEKLE